MSERACKLVWMAALAVGACKDDAAGEGDATAESTSHGSISAGSEGGSSSETSIGSAGEDTGVDPPKYDLGGVPDAPPPLGCDGGKGGGGGGTNDPLYSYIWISNSSQGTVSKIDTTTLEEVGRYDTHPATGDPSRTSVSLNGNVAVANRNGGLVKFYANKADCEDKNGNGVIDTSTGANDVLAWDEEECRAWFTPFDYTSQRPVAWTPGQWDPSECRYENEKVWTAGASDNGFGKPGGGEDGFEGVHVVLVDGDSGAVEHAVKIPEVLPNYFGIYGGAVDAAGNFWGSQLSLGDIVRVDLETYEYDVWPMAVDGYGMTVDHEGYVWTCAWQVGRFDPDTETWETAQVNGSGGCMEDGEGTLWLASNPVVGVDIETLEVVATWPVPNGAHGVSIDFQGYVWGVSMGNDAYRIDPMTGEFDTYSGLTGAYTYSDMTGFALANAGGWVPAG